MLIGQSPLSLNDYRALLTETVHVDIPASSLKTVSDSYTFLQEFAQGKVIYGVNTGLGPMAQYILSPSKSHELQYNLIRSHATGMGDPLPDVFIRALMITRLNTLLLGKSGVHPDTVLLLKDMLNARIYPRVFAHGGVGASGDLVQLAHLALGMIGEGMVSVEGQICPAQEALDQAGLTPLKIYLREGLAIMNGTSVMTGVGIINVLDAMNILNWSVAISSMLNEIVEAYSDAFSTSLNKVKRHKGQRQIAAQMTHWLEDSKLIRNRADHLYKGGVPEGKTQDKVQEYYSVRCIPQILGPVFEAITEAGRVVIDECNSASDNPIISAEDKNIYHGGNFHGDYVAFEMDKLKIAITKLSMLAERQLNYLLNSNLNLKLPPFLNRGTLGLNFGLQGAQFTATSTVAENQSLSFPMYLHSIPSNNDNQDIVSMGANAAHMTHKVLVNTFQVLAIELVAIMQSVDHLEIADRLSSRSAGLYQKIRPQLQINKSDQVLSQQLQDLAAYISTHPLQADDSRV
jgi:histidine ammonia-lyase